MLAHSAFPFGSPIGPDHLWGLENTDLAQRVDSSTIGEVAVAGPYSETFVDWERHTNWPGDCHLACPTTSQACYLAAGCRTVVAERLADDHTAVEVSWDHPCLGVSAHFGSSRIEKNVEADPFVVHIVGAVVEGS